MNFYHRIVNPGHHRLRRSCRRKETVPSRQDFSGEARMAVERLEKADQMDIQEYRQALTRRDALYTSFAGVA